jgi:hypothetical protein
VADPAGARVSAKGRAAARRETGGVRIETASTHAPGRVARGAIALRMAAHARRQVALCLPGVVAGRAWARGEHRGRRVHPALAAPLGGWPGLGHADPQMARPAERLGMVARRAPRAVLARRDRVHRQPVVGVHAARPHPAVVAPRAVVFRVTACAKAAPVPGHAAVAGCQKARHVVGMTEPARRQKAARRKVRHETAVRPGQMAGRALGPSVAARLRRQVVTTQAPVHARKLVASRQAQPLDRSVALAAPDVAARVGAVAEHELRGRQVRARHALAVLRRPPLVAEPAAPSPVPRHDRARARVQRAVASVAHRGRGQQAVRGAVARARERVAVEARERTSEVAAVVEAQRDALARKNGEARPGGAQGRSGRQRARGRSSGAPARRGPVGSGRGGDREQRERGEARVQEPEARVGRHFDTLNCSNASTR